MHVIIARLREIGERGWAVTGLDKADVCGL